MRNLKITLGALLITMSANFSMAQSNVEKATVQTEKMNSQLTLTPEQKARVSELNFGIIDKNDAITKDQNTSAEFKKQSIEGNNAARLELLRGILTTEQYEVYKKSIANGSTNNVKPTKMKSKSETISPAQ